MAAKLGKFRKTQNPMHPYHSARLPEVVNARPGVRAKTADGCAVLVHDLCTGLLPEAYRACDVLYVEMPWRAGYQKFMERAGAAGRFGDYCLALSRLLETDSRPAFVVTAPSLVRHLPPTYQSRVPLCLLGGGCVLLGYRGPLPEVPLPGQTTEDFIRALAVRYDCVGDPSCGYGNSGRIFWQNGKKFVMSDVNAKCVDYVAEHMGEWGFLR